MGPHSEFVFFVLALHTHKYKVYLELGFYMKEKHTKIIIF